MVLLPNNENLNASSGIINTAFLEQVYHSLMDEMMIDLGRTIVLHLDPAIEQDIVTQSQAAPQQYNPYFGRVPVPQINTRHAGVKITPRDVQYRAQIRIGPIKADEDTEGIGDLADNEAMITLVIESLPHLKQTQSVTVEGRRYSIDNTRPIGFSQRRYIMVKLTAIDEQQPPSPDITIG